MCTEKNKAWKQVEEIVGASGECTWLVQLACMSNKLTKLARSMQIKQPMYTLISVLFTLSFGIHFNQKSVVGCRLFTFKIKKHSLGHAHKRQE